MKKIANLYTTGLNKDIAWWMAKISKLVYEKVSKEDQIPNEKLILSTLQKLDPKFVSVTGFDNNSAQAAIIVHEDYLCWAFRGTNEIVDWLDNINAFSTKKLFGEFHRGFWKSVEDVWEGLWKKHKELQGKKKRPLFITGHSLGGAMATIAAARLVHKDRPFYGVYTFGQPRTMTRDTALIFNSECKSRFFRFQNDKDIVTRVPARLMGYSHVGSYFYINEEKEIHREVGFWFRFVDAIDVDMLNIKGMAIESITDHNMDHYIQAMENWV